MTGRSDLHNIEVYLRRETARAFGIANPGKPGELIWLPKSQCEIETRPALDKPDILTAPEWLLKERGLI